MDLYWFVIDLTNNCIRHTETTHSDALITAKKVQTANPDWLIGVVSNIRILQRMDTIDEHTGKEIA